MDEDQYTELLNKNTTKAYRKTNKNCINKINKDARKTAKPWSIDDRIEKIQESQTYITVKDHQDNFPHSIPCRLINPSKTYIGKISKAMLDKINIQYLPLKLTNRKIVILSSVGLRRSQKRSRALLLFLILKISTLQSPWNSSTKHCSSQKVYVKPMKRLVLLCKQEKLYFLTIPNHRLKSLGIKILMFLWAALMKQKFLKLLKLTFYAK